MPDLESRIAEWRRQLIAGGITSPEVLDELESHLREDIERQMRSGLDVTRAFEAAVEKIGDAHALQSEFVKADPPKQPLRPAVLRVGGVIMAIFILTINAWTLFADDLNALQRTVAFGFVIVATWALFMRAFRFRQSVFPALNSPRGAAIMKFTSLFVVVWPVVAICSAANLIHVHIGLTAEMFIWNLYAVCTMTLLSVHFYSDAFDALTATPWSFTARQSFAIARAEASGFYHDFIGTEHLLLGLLKSESAVVPGILNKLGVNEDAIRSEIRKFVDIGPAHEVSAAIPLTPRARKALQLAAEEAKARHHSAPGAEHIFLGLLLEDSGVAAVALKNLGVRLEKAREIISNELL